MPTLADPDRIDEYAARLRAASLRVVNAGEAAYQSIVDGTAGWSVQHGPLADFEKYVYARVCPEDMATAPCMNALSVNLLRTADTLEQYAQACRAQEQANVEILLTVGLTLVTLVLPEFAPASLTAAGEVVAEVSMGARMGSVLASMGMGAGMAFVGDVVPELVLHEGNWAMVDWRRVAMDMLWGAATFGVLSLAALALEPLLTGLPWVGGRLAGWLKNPVVKVVAQATTATGVMFGMDALGQELETGQVDVGRAALSALQGLAFMGLAHVMGHGARPAVLDTGDGYPGLVVVESGDGRPVVLGPEGRYPKETVLIDGETGKPMPLERLLRPPVGENRTIKLELAGPQGLEQVGQGEQVVVQVVGKDGSRSIYLADGHGRLQLTSAFSAEGAPVALTAGGKLYWVDEGGAVGPAERRVVLMTPDGELRYVMLGSGEGWAVYAPEEGRPGMLSYLGKGEFLLGKVELGSGESVLAGGVGVKLGYELRIESADGSYREPVGLEGMVAQVVSGKGVEVVLMGPDGKRMILHQSTFVDDGLVLTTTEGELKLPAGSSIDFGEGGALARVKVPEGPQSDLTALYRVEDGKLALEAGPKLVPRPETEPFSVTTGDVVDPGNPWAPIEEVFPLTAGGMTGPPGDPPLATEPPAAHLDATWQPWPAKDVWSPDGMAMGPSAPDFYKDFWAGSKAQPIQWHGIRGDGGIGGRPLPPLSASGGQQQQQQQHLPTSNGGAKQDLEAEARKAKQAIRHARGVLGQLPLRGHPWFRSLPGAAGALQRYQERQAEAMRQLSEAAARLSELRSLGVGAGTGLRDLLVVPDQVPATVLSGEVPPIVPDLPDQLLPRLLPTLAAGVHLVMPGSQLSPLAVEAQQEVLVRLFDPAHSQELNWLNSRPAKRPHGPPFEVAFMVKRLPLQDPRYMDRKYAGGMMGVLTHQVKGWVRWGHFKSDDGSEAWLVFVDDIAEERKDTHRTQPVTFRATVGQGDAWSVDGQLRFQETDATTNEYGYPGAKLVLGGVVRDAQGRRYQVGPAYVPSGDVTAQRTHTQGWQISWGLSAAWGPNEYSFGGKHKLTPTGSVYQWTNNLGFLALDKDFELYDLPDNPPLRFDWPSVPITLPNGWQLQLAVDPTKTGKASVAIWLGLSRDPITGAPVMKTWTIDPRKGIWRLPPLRWALERLATRQVQDVPTPAQPAAPELTVPNWPGRGMIWGPDGAKWHFDTPPMMSEDLRGAVKNLGDVVHGLGAIPADADLATLDSAVEDLTNAISPVQEVWEAAGREHLRISQTIAHADALLDDLGYRADGRYIAEELPAAQVAYEQAGKRLQEAIELPHQPPARPQLKSPRLSMAWGPNGGTWRLQVPAMSDDLREALMNLTAMIGGVGAIPADAELATLDTAAEYLTNAISEVRNEWGAWGWDRPGIPGAIAGADALLEDLAYRAAQLRYEQAGDRLREAIEFWHELPPRYRPAGVTVPD